MFINFYASPLRKPIIKINDSSRILKQLHSGLKVAQILLGLLKTYPPTFITTLTHHQFSEDNVSCFPGCDQTERRLILTESHSL